MATFYPREPTGRKPEKTERTSPYARAKEFCDRCPVIQQCRDAADVAEEGLSRDHIFGMFGGERPGERVFRRHKATA